MPNPNDITTTENNAAANKAAAAARKETQDKAHERIRNERADMLKNNEQKMVADAKLKPTPTPDEIAAALAGKSVDEKEPDGSPPQDSRVHPRAASAEGNDAPYRTRQLSPQQGGLKNEPKTEPKT